jgi:hypothetical protein
MVAMQINVITYNKQAANNATMSQCRSLSSIWRQILGKYKIIIKILSFSGKMKNNKLGTAETILILWNI